MFLPFGKAEGTASPLLSRVRGSYYSFTLDAADLQHPQLLQRQGKAFFFKDIAIAILQSGIGSAELVSEIFGKEVLF